MNYFFDINSIFFEAWGYKMSHLEWWATVSGAVAVWLSARENIWSWVLGLLNVVLAFALFYQIQLYPDMFLQVFFFITNLIGLWAWTHPRSGENNINNELKISKLSQQQWLWAGLTGLVCTIILGTFSQNLSHFLPTLFSKPSAFPYLDSFTTVMSIIATFLLVQKKVEAWFVWLLVDVISTYMYFIKDVKLYSLLYFVFCLVAIFGTINWTREYKKGLVV